MKKKRYVYIGAWFKPLSFNFLRRRTLPPLMTPGRKKP